LLVRYTAVYERLKIGVKDYEEFLLEIGLHGFGYQIVGLDTGILGD
jgi:hypothetical protein